MSKKKVQNGGGSDGQTFEFQARASSNLAGFWRPEKGDVLHGIIVEKAEGPRSDYLIVEVTQDTKVTSRDRQTGEELVRSAKKGRQIGVSYSAQLRGLEDHAGRGLTLTYHGKKSEKGENGETIHRHVFTIHVTHRILEPKYAQKLPVQTGESRRRARQPFPAAPVTSRTDDDIPF